ncbi:MAG: hypothetical protein HY22_08955 [[Candidatus Thermochlorobacteriaceae] bacterium GBChlB]|jgi:DnaJ-domain-containing protein 1|nr:MAG: hypothetical protein HY22_08955 [[Candidatus Thermochlorobacteriaceae] bacterium GBChlB]
MSVLSRLIRVLKAYTTVRGGAVDLSDTRWEDLLKEAERQYNRARKKASEEFNARRSSQHSYQKKSYQNSGYSSYSNSSSSTSSYQTSKDAKLAGYYANLEAPYGSDLETVRQAWRKMVAKYHPDKFSSDPEKQKIATELTKGINHAYEELSKHLKQSL